MNKMMRTIGVLLAVVSLSTNRSASASISFTGRVLDCNQQGVPGVNVSVGLRNGTSCGTNNSNNSVIACVTTDANGDYSFVLPNPLQPGNTWAGNWCFNTYGTVAPSCTNDLPCCNGYICTGGGVGLSSSSTNGAAYTANPDYS